MYLLKNIICNVLLVFSCIGFISCYSIPTVPKDMDAKRDTVKLPALELPPKMVYTKYIYEGAKYQDPFIQLGSGNVVIVQKETMKGGIDPSVLLFKGVIKGKSKSIGLMADTAGNAYFIKNMKLIDMKNRVIPGVVGVIKSNSVIIETEDGVSREIKLYE